MDREQNPLPLLELTEWEERGIPPPSTRFNRVKEEGNPSLYSISNERVGGMGFGRRQEKGTWLRARVGQHNFPLHIFLKEEE